jgi:hypothetical protein
MGKQKKNATGGPDKKQAESIARGKAPSQPSESVPITTGPRGGTTGIYRNERKGTTLARMTLYLEPDLQRAVKQAALDRNVSANTLIMNAIKKELGLP